MRFLSTMMIALASLWSLTLRAGPPVIIHGDITVERLESAAAQIMLAATAEENPTITIDIDSRGGLVDPSVAFTDFLDTVRRATGAEFRCVANNKVYSAAFYLFAMCDTRVASKFATFMWHPIRVMGIEEVASPEELFVISADLLLTTYKLNEVVSNKMNLPFARLRPLWEREEIMTLETLMRIAPDFVEQSRGVAK
jgi:ATP-dependent protease ClpP protease subunit